MADNVIGSASYELDLDKKKFDSGLDSASKNFKEFGSKLKDVGGDITTRVSLPIVAIGGYAIKMASDMSESLNKVNVAFKEDAKTVLDFADTSLKSFGIAKGTALDMASTYGDMGTAMGLSTEEASKMSTTLVGLSGDLASFKNISTEQGSQALRGIFTGEGESLKSLGVIMQDTTLEAYALSSGMGKTYKDMTQAERVQLRYNFVLANTKNAQGDYGRTFEGLANQSRYFTESLKEVAQQMGDIMLPIATKLITKINELVAKFMALTPEQKKMVIIIGLIVASIGPLLLIIGQLVTAIGIIAGAISAPVVAIGLLIAGLVLLQTQFGIFNPIINGIKILFESLKMTWDTLVLAFQSPQVQNAIVQLQSAFALLQEKLTPLFDKIKELTGTGGEAGSFFSLETAINLVVGVITGLTNTIIFITPIIEFLVSAVIKAIDTFIWFKDAVTKVITNVILFFTNFDANIKKLWNNIVNTIKSTITNLANMFLNFFTVQIPYFIGSAIRFFMDLPAKLPVIMASINAIIINAWNGIKNLSITIVSSLVASVVSFFSTLPDKLRGIWNTIISYLGSLPATFSKAGSDAIQGLWDGMKKTMSSVVNWMNQQVKKIQDAFKLGLKIKSPSKVFDYYGQMIGKGLENGLSSSMDGIYSMYNKMIPDANLNFNGVNTALQGQGTVSNMFNITIAPEGIVARSRAEFRDIIADGIEAVNEDLVARGYDPLGNGKIVGSSTI